MLDSVCFFYERPQTDISLVENRAFIQSTEDCQNSDGHLTFHIMEVPGKYLPCFKRFEHVLPKFITHSYMNETAKKSDYVVLGIHTM